MAVASGERGSASQLSPPEIWFMKCPTCSKQVDWQDNPFRPFCSERCKLVDLSKWVSEEYRVPGRPVPAEPLEDEEDHPQADTSSSEFKL